MGKGRSFIATRNLTAAALARCVRTTSRYRPAWLLRPMNQLRQAFAT